MMLLHVINQEIYYQNVIEKGFTIAFLSNFLYSNVNFCSNLFVFWTINNLFIYKSIFFYKKLISNDEINYKISIVFWIVHQS